MNRLCEYACVSEYRDDDSDDEFKQLLDGVGGSSNSAITTTLRISDRRV